MSHKASHGLPPGSSLISFPSTLPLAHSVQKQKKTASFLFLKYTSYVPSSGPLYWTQNSRQISAWLISSLLWIELCPSKRFIEVLIPGTCECGLIWKSCLCRCNPVKMKSLKWDIIQHDRCL